MTTILITGATAGVMAGKRRKFDAEFREGAVRIRRRDRQADRAGREGPGDQRQDAGQMGVPRPQGQRGRGGQRERGARAVATGERQLKKDNKELAMERDVLKRCMVHWVK
ncbi:hypothetical protein GCM10009574_073860 [Streptomyces asiaticus]|uniref:Uncharacterized protein n=2 Tax=Streptomyces rhizosphaericus TaxID=114699 RepID=A0ABN1P0A9_9ACTN